MGWDVSGEIVQVGKNVTARKVGERVAAFVHGGYWRDRGAFSEYVKVQGELLWVVPEKTSFEEAATLSCGWVKKSRTRSLGDVLTFCERAWTVVQSLFSPTRLGLVEPDTEGIPIPRNEWVFVYGGSSQSFISLPSRICLTQTRSFLRNVRRPALACCWLQGRHDSLSA